MSTEENTEVSGEQSIPASDVEQVRVEDEVEQSYIDYAMSVIAGRSLPDARDGLKPVHRRILYAMHEDNVTNSKSHRKSSNIVGAAMGDYHPHGDASIYDALVRMAQDFSMRYPLVDGQGNFGSIDGDSAAAMRYTEARLSKMAEALLEDLEKDTVEMESNYDGRLTEPSVLPAAFPNLLVNGSMGIAVGMSTNIPPHNLTEVINATVEYLESEECSVSDLMEYVKGPDFPTGANIVGTDGIEEAYKTGKGRIRVRADYYIEEGSSNEREKIIVTEIPYAKNKSKLVEKIAEKVRDGELGGIATIRDESDRDGIRIVIEVKNDSVSEVVANQLVDSVLEETFSIINLALVNGNPQVLSLKEMIAEYVRHRREVVRRRSEDQLEEAEDRAHLLEGRLTALENVDDVVDLIQSTEDRDSAIGQLTENFELSQEQAEHVVRMQLGSLTSMEKTDIHDEYESVSETIEYLQSVLDDTDKLDQVIIDELEEVKDKYGDERKTTIIQDADEVTDEDLIPEEDSYFFVSKSNYLKRTPVDEFRTQHRGGKGLVGTGLRDDDVSQQVFRASTHTTIYFFTNEGNVYSLRGHEIPESGRNARGTPAVNLLNLNDSERIQQVTTADNSVVDEEDAVLLLGTKNGLVKKTDASAYDNIYASGLRAINLEEGDEVVSAEFTTDSGSLLVSTTDGRSIRFNLDDVREVGRNTKGVNAMKTNGATVTSMTHIPEDYAGSLLSITENGFGRRTDVSNYRIQSRYGKGILDVSTGDRNGNLVQTLTVTDDDTVSFLTLNGTLLETEAEEISVVGRNTKGVKLMDIDDTTVVSADLK